MKVRSCPETLRSRDWISPPRLGSGVFFLFFFFLMAPHPHADGHRPRRPRARRPHHRGPAHPHAERRPPFAAGPRRAPSIRPVDHPVRPRPTPNFPTWTVMPPTRTPTGHRRAAHGARRRPPRPRPPARRRRPPSRRPRCSRRSGWNHRRVRSATRSPSAVRVGRETPRSTSWWACRVKTPPRSTRWVRRHPARADDSRFRLSCRRSENGKRREPCAW